MRDSFIEANVLNLRKEKYLLNLKKSYNDEFLQIEYKFSENKDKIQKYIEDIKKNIIEARNKNLSIEDLNIKKNLSELKISKLKSNHLNRITELKNKYKIIFNDFKEESKNISTINEVDETNKIETIEKKLQLDMKKNLLLM